LKLDGVDIHSIEDLLREIHKRKIGEKVRLVAVREDREHFFELTLSRMP